MEGKNSGGFWEFIKVVIISLLIVLPIRMYIAQPFIVAGASMEPNFYNGEYLIIDELSYLLGEPKRGDVVVFRYPLDTSQFFIKRIVGLPGETVVIENGGVFVKSGEKTFKMPEQYLPAGRKTLPAGTWGLGAEGEYFVMGDNRERSSDSRHWGVLDENNITGRAFIRLWPVARAGMLE